LVQKLWLQKEEPTLVFMIGLLVRARIEGPNLITKRCKTSRIACSGKVHPRVHEYENKVEPQWIGKSWSYPSRVQQF